MHLAMLKRNYLQWSEQRLAPRVCGFEQWNSVYVDVTNVVQLYTDSSASKSLVSRRALGKMRQLKTKGMWLQREVVDGVCQVSKVKGEDNPADSMTNILTKGKIVDMCAWMSLVVDSLVVV